MRTPPPIKESIVGVGGTISRIWNRYFTDLASSVEDMENKDVVIDPAEQPIISLSDISKMVQEEELKVNQLSSKIAAAEKRIKDLEKLIASGAL